MADRRIKKLLWPSDSVLTFPLGMDTYHVMGKAIRPTSLATLQNAEMTTDGSLQTRRGRTLYLTMPDTVAPVLGMHELILRDGTAYLLLVQNGKLYKYAASTVTHIPVRLSTPYPAYADDSYKGERFDGAPLLPGKEATTGAVGANLTASRTYEWACVAVKGTGKTTFSAAVRVKTSATPHPVDLVFHGVYRADSYEIWRRHSTDSGGTWSAWGRMKVGLAHATEPNNGKTLLNWMDDGTVVPDTLQTLPATNTTEHTLPTNQRVDFETWDASWNGENAAYFVNGDGYCRTNGTLAEIVQPTDPKTYLESAAGINALGDVTWPGHTARGMTWHHGSMFYGDVTDRPNVFYWSRADDAAHVPQLAAIEAPTHGGRILDFRVKDAQLGVGATSGIFSLVGHNFRTIPPSTDVYFSEASDKGVVSEWSLVRAPHGWLMWLNNEKRILGMAHLQPDPERTDVFEVAEAIRPTLDELTDLSNAAGLWANDAYMLSFPGDQILIRLYQRRDPQGGLTVAPVIDTASAFGQFYRRLDGAILGTHATSGYVYELFKDSVFTDSGAAYTFRMETQKLDMGSPRHPKKFRWVRVFYQCAGRVNLDYRLETVEGIDQGTVTMAGSLGYDEGLYDEATYDPWTSPYVDLECENAEEGTQIQVTLSSQDFIRINGLTFLYDRKRP